MIDWGNVPVGSIADIHRPQVQATAVINLADQIYSFHALEVADANTIQCQVTKSVTYVPIPPGTGENYASSSHRTAHHGPSRARVQCGSAARGDNLCECAATATTPATAAADGQVPLRTAAGGDD